MKIQACVYHIVAHSIASRLAIYIPEIEPFGCLRTLLFSQVVEAPRYDELGEFGGGA